MAIQVTFNPAAGLTASQIALSNGLGRLVNAGVTITGSSDREIKTSSGTIRLSSASTSEAVAFNNGGSERARFSATNGDLLIGKTSNDGTGKIQLASHTTAAGGIGFGSDISAYRKSSGELTLLSACLGVDRTSSTDIILIGRNTGQAHYRFEALVNGKLSWGPGSATRDVSLERAGVGVLDVTGALRANTPALLTDDRTVATTEWVNDTLAQSYVESHVTGVSQAGGSSAGFAIFDDVAAPRVTLTAGTWLLSGSVAWSANGGSYLWAVFHDETNAVDFGGGACAAYDGNAVSPLKVDGIITVPSGTVDVVFKVLVNNASTVTAGNATYPAGSITALRIR